MESRYQAFVAAVARAIYEADPIRLLEAGAPTDEYSSEIGAILARIVAAQRSEDVTEVLHEEFVRWFGERIAGPRQASKRRRVRFGTLYSNVGRAADTGPRVRQLNGGYRVVAANR